MIPAESLDEAASNELLGVLAESDEIAEVAGRIPWETVSGLASRIELTLAKWALALGRSLLNRTDDRATKEFLRMHPV